jgi:hypothetical protein
MSYKRDSSLNAEKCIGGFLHFECFGTEKSSEKDTLSFYKIHTKKHKRGEGGFKRTLNNLSEIC